MKLWSKGKSWYESKSWRDLRSFGNSRLIRTSYIWLFVVPAAVRLIDPLVGVTFDLSKLGIADCTVNFDLPRGWISFYLMSLAFAAGQTIYFLVSPKLVDQFQSFADYSKAHAGWEPLVSMLSLTFQSCTKDEMEALHDSMRERLIDLPDRITNQFPLTNACPAANPTAREGIARMYVTEGHGIAEQRPGMQSDMFARMLDWAKRLRGGWLRACKACFAAGVVFFLFTVAQNLLVVGWYLGTELQAYAQAIWSRLGC